MNKEITLNDVLSFSAQFGFEKEGFNIENTGFLLLALAAGAFGILCAVYGTVARESMGMIVGVTFLAFGMGSGMFFYTDYQYVSNDQQQLFIEKEREWKVQYAEPYLATLPVESFTGIEHIEYNAALENITAIENEYKPLENELPLRLLTANGEGHDLWATIVPLGDKKVETIEYIHIPEDLLFHDLSKPLLHAGYHRIVLYTDRKI